MKPRAVVMSRRALHQPELTRADHVARGIVERAVDRNEIGACQQFVERDFRRAALGDGLVVEIGIAGQHVHVEQRLAEPGDAAADIAEAMMPMVRWLMSLPVKALRSCIVPLRSA